MFKVPTVNMVDNSQTLRCAYDPNTGGYWTPNPIACEPKSCKFPPPTAPSDTIYNVIYNPNKATSMQYQTTIAYMCPSNMSLPSLISSNFSLDYPVSKGFVYNVTAYCEVDG